MEEVVRSCHFETPPLLLQKIGEFSKGTEEVDRRIYSPEVHLIFFNVKLYLCYSYPKFVFNVKLYLFHTYPKFVDELVPMLRK